MKIKILFLLATLSLSTAFSNLTPIYKQGDQKSYSGTLEATLTQKIPSPQSCDLVYHIVFQGDASVQVLAVQKSGAADLSIKIQNPAAKFSLKCDMQNAMSFDLSFDSAQDNPEQMQEMQIAKSLVDCLNGMELTVKVDDLGKIVEVSGAKEIQEKVQKQLQEAPILQTTGDNLCALLQTENIKKALSFLTLYLPGKEVKKGDTWKQPFHLLGIPLAQNWTYQGETGETVTLTESTTIVETPIKSEGVTIFDKISGQAAETVVLSKPSHWILSHEAKLDAAAAQTINFPLSEEPTTIQYDIKAATTIKQK